MPTFNPAERKRWLDVFYLRIANAPTLYDAQVAAFVLWHEMNGTCEGWQCSMCSLNLSGGASPGPFSGQKPLGEHDSQQPWQTG
jgi:hypothetical protein